MSYGILWITRLAWSLLIVAAVAALAGRCEKPHWRRLWPVLAAILILLIDVATVVVGVFVLTKNIQPKWLMGYELSQAIAFLICVIIILRRGLRGIRSGQQGARSWSRLGLSAAFGVVLLIYMLTLNSIETNILVDLANARAEATDKVMDLVPPRLPDTLNAGPVYEEAVEMLGPKENLPQWLVSRQARRPDFDPTSDEATRFLAKHERLLSTIRKAAAMPGYYQEFDLTDFRKLRLPYMLVYLRFADLLGLSARSKALAGNYTDAMQDLFAMEGIADHLRSFPLLIYFMIGVSVDESRVQSLEYTLAHISDPSSDVYELPVSAHPSLLSTYLRSLSVESLGNLQTLALDMGGWYTSKVNMAWGPGVSGAVYSLTKFYRVFFLPSELTAMKDIIVYGMSKPAETYGEARKNARAIIEAAEAGEMGLLTSLSIPGYFNYLVRAMKNDAIRSMADVALAATAFKAANGSHPVELNDLVPDYLNEIPMDPFDEKPLKIKVVDGGLDIYSIGPGPELSPGKKREPIHFYLGAKAFEKYRVKPAREAPKK